MNSTRLFHILFRARLMLLVMGGLLGTSSGCHFLKPNPIDNSRQFVAPELVDDVRPQFEQGQKHKFIDTVGNIVGIPNKILLWDRRIDNHTISENTLVTIADYLQANNLAHVKVRANQYDPIDEWKRLRANKTMSPFIRYTVGTFSVAHGALLPGRILGGDHFNPYTQSIHLYSDIPAIALHEAGHAKDFSRRKYQGLYSLAYSILPLWHETLATEDAYHYLQMRGDQQLLAEADRILYPAYGTYVGSALGNLSPTYSFPIYLGSVALGHANGRILAKQRSTGRSQLAEQSGESAISQVAFEE